MNPPILTGQQGTDTVNPYAPIVPIERFEVKRVRRPVWVIPILLASGSIALVFACTSLGIALGEPHANDSSEYRLKVYANGITAMASGSFCALLLLISLVRGSVPRACLLLLLIPALCAFFGWALIEDYEGDQDIRDAVQRYRLQRQVGR